MSTPTQDRPRTDRPVRRRAGHDDTLRIELRERRGLTDHARNFDPDRRWYHPFIAVMWLYTLAGLPRWTGLSPWFMAGVGAAGTVAAVMSAKKFYDTFTYGVQQHKHAVHLTWASGALGTTWLVYAGFSEPTRPLFMSISAFGLLIFGGLTMGAFYAHIRTKAPRQQQVQAERRQEALVAHQEYKEAVEQEKAADEWEKILADAGAEGVAVLNKKPTEAGFTLTVRDNPKKPIKIAGLRGLCGTIASIAAHRLSDQGIHLREDQVRAEPGESAHMMYLHVSTTNRFSKSLDYPLDQPISSIKQPICPGLYEDGTHIKLSLLGVHGCMCGATGSGKDVFTNNLIAGCTRCNDCMVWIGGTDKLTSLVWPWLAPLFRKMGVKRPILDYVAGEDPTRVLRQLATLYKIAKLRNKRLGPLSKHQPTPEDPAIFLVITEASDLLMDNSNVKVKTFDGHEWNGSQLINAITRMARSAACMVFMATQYGLMDALGDYGSFAKRNITMRIAGKTYTYSDGTATLVGMDGVDTTKLRDFTLLIQPSIEEPRTIPAKAFLLDGEQLIQPVVLRNSANVATRLPSWVVSALHTVETSNTSRKWNEGDEYAGRWEHDRLPELYEVVLDQGLNWPAIESIPSDERETVDEEFRRITENMDGLDTQMNPEDDPDMNKTADELLEEGAAAMQRAREDIARHGTLGATMSAVLDKVSAGNAPEFVPADLLAIVIDRIDQDAPKAELDQAAQALIDELAGKPWNLQPVVFQGDRGWTKQALMTRIREYLTGEEGPVPEPRVAQGEPQQRAQQAVAEPLHTLLTKLEGFTGEFVTMVDAAEMLGGVMSANELSRQLSEKFGLGLQRPRNVANVDGRPRGWFVADLRAAANQQQM